MHALSALLTSALAKSLQNWTCSLLRCSRCGCGSVDCGVVWYVLWLWRCVVCVVALWHCGVVALWHCGVVALCGCMVVWCAVVCV